MPEVIRNGRSADSICADSARASCTELKIFIQLKQELSDLREILNYGFNLKLEFVAGSQF